MPRLAKCCTLLMSSSMASPFSIPVSSERNPLRLLRSMSASERAWAMYLESLSMVSSILSNIRSAYSRGVLAPNGAIWANVSPGFGCGRYATMVTASGPPSCILCRSYSIRGSRWSKCMPSGKNIGVSQWESSVMLRLWKSRIRWWIAASLTSQRNSGRPSSASHSGCHCTPITGFCSLLSMASMVPSGAVAAVRMCMPGLSTA